VELVEEEEEEEIWPVEELHPHSLGVRFLADHTATQYN